MVNVKRNLALLLVQVFLVSNLSISGAMGYEDKGVVREAGNNLATPSQLLVPATQQAVTAMMVDLAQRQHPIFTQENDGYVFEVYAIHGSEKANITVKVLNKETRTVLVEKSGLDVDWIIVTGAASQSFVGILEKMNASGLKFTYNRLTGRVSFGQGLRGGVNVRLQKMVKNTTSGLFQKSGDPKEYDSVTTDLSKTVFYSDEDCTQKVETANLQAETVYYYISTPKSSAKQVAPRASASSLGAAPAPAPAALALSASLTELPAAIPAPAAPSGETAMVLVQQSAQIAETIRRQLAEITKRDAKDIVTKIKIQFEQILINIDERAIPESKVDVNEISFRPITMILPKAAPAAPAASASAASAPAVAEGIRKLIAEMQNPDNQNLARIQGEDWVGKLRAISEQLEAVEREAAAHAAPAVISSGLSRQGAALLHSSAAVQVRKIGEFIIEPKLETAESITLCADEPELRQYLAELTVYLAKLQYLSGKRSEEENVGWNYEIDFADAPENLDISQVQEFIEYIKTGYGTPKVFPITRYNENVSARELEAKRRAAEELCRIVVLKLRILQEVRPIELTQVLAFFAQELSLQANLQGMVMAEQLTQQLSVLNLNAAIDALKEDRSEWEQWRQKLLKQLQGLGMLQEGMLADLVGTLRDGDLAPTSPVRELKSPVVKKEIIGYLERVATEQQRAIAQLREIILRNKAAVDAQLLEMLKQKIKEQSAQVREALTAKEQAAAARLAQQELLQQIEQDLLVSQERPLEIASRYKLELAGLNIDVPAAAQQIRAALEVQKVLAVREYIFAILEQQRGVLVKKIMAGMDEEQKRLFAEQRKAFEEQMARLVAVQQEELKRLQEEMRKAIAEKESVKGKEILELKQTHEGTLRRAVQQVTLKTQQEQAEATQRKEAESVEKIKRVIIQITQNKDLLNQLIERMKQDKLNLEEKLVIEVERLVMSISIDLTKVEKAAAKITNRTLLDGIDLEQTEVRESLEGLGVITNAYDERRTEYLESYYMTISHLEGIVINLSNKQEEIAALGNENLSREVEAFLSELRGAEELSGIIVQIKSDKVFSEAKNEEYLRVIQEFGQKRDALLLEFDVLKLEKLSATSALIITPAFTGFGFRVADVIEGQPALNEQQLNAVLPANIVPRGITVKVSNKPMGVIMTSDAAQSVIVVDQNFYQQVVSGQLSKDFFEFWFRHEIGHILIGRHAVDPEILKPLYVQMVGKVKGEVDTLEPLEARLDRLGLDLDKVFEECAATFLAVGQMDSAKFVNVERDLTGIMGQPQYVDIRGKLAGSAEKLNALIRMVHELAGQPLAAADLAAVTAKAPAAEAIARNIMENQLVYYWA